MDIILDPKKHYSYADYLTWLDGKRRELVNGFIRMMSPAPTLSHARISRKIFVSLVVYIEKNKGKCQVFSAPFDVRLPKNGETADDKVHTVVQPDICVICDTSKLEERGCLGAPNLVVEILSPSTRKFDLNDKFNLYQEAGVEEYWVVSPKDKDVIVFLLQQDGKYDDGTVYEFNQKRDVPVQTI
ncbi:Uma2 family endonuclease, partial [Bacteroides sp. OttesenSCG-928-E20]|nr:Uma2 family endonuclease [Bacteroides sp. OttesenSCG-928-E20]